MVKIWWKVVPYLPFIVLFMALMVGIYHVKYYW